MARDFGMTRAAVWKRIQNLRAAGVDIEGRAGDGYGLAYPVELLDADTIRKALCAEADASLNTLEVAWTLESTNATLLKRVTPPVGVDVLLAERQTGGRGRRGRQWASPLAAHLYMSLSREFAGGLTRLAGLSLAMGVAAAEGLRQLGFSGVGLKWPNDLVVDGHKLGGLLIEGGGEIAGTARAVIGIGVNVHMPPAFAAGIGQPWVDLDTLAGRPFSRNQVVASLLASMLPALDLFAAEGLAPFLHRFSALDVLAGREINVEEAGTHYRGVACGLAEDGGLRVTIDGMERVFHAGEVSVRPA